MNEPSFLNRLLRSVVEPGKRLSAGRKAKQVIELCQALLSERGEVSGAVLARETLSAYLALPEPALQVFFDLLARNFLPAPDDVHRAYEAYRAQPTPDNLTRLQRVVEPVRQELFRRLNMAAGGTSALIEMRRRVLAGLAAHPDWKSVDADLAHLFNSWFNRGFLTLERIDWHTPAIILEKLIQYEAVHQIEGWRDLHRRLEDDRRCFAFFHPALPDEPLIFIEVALTKGMSGAVQPLLDLDSPVLDPAAADAAIFYSITNCQRGLRGVSFGNLLIKQVAQELGREFPRIKTFATLSPVPGFRRWLTAVTDQLAALPAGRALIADFKRLDDPEWLKRDDVGERMRHTLMPLCAYYLVNAKNDRNSPDAVARFHLGNGARLERVNWLADTSPRGMQHSCGLMVNYLYRLDDVEKNHEVYAKEHRVVASRALRKLAGECLLVRPAKKAG